MHHKYTTEGFLVSSRGSGEADKLFLFYTREFGMIQTHATSVRSSKSKLRPHISAGVPLSITVLRSKAGWKLVEAVKRDGGLPRGSKSYLIFSRLLVTLRTLVTGEEKNESLFEAVLSAYSFFASTNDENILSAAECLAMLKIMHALGYGEPKSDRNYELANFDMETVLEVAKDRKELVQGINKALEATGL